MTGDPSREEALAIARHGALSRDMVGKPRGTRARAADARVPVPGHYYPGTSAEFVVPAEPFRLDRYLLAARRGPDELTRRTAVNVVGEFGNASCVGALGDVLHGAPTGEGATDELTRCCAAYALASIGGPEAEEHLWRALESAGCAPRVREAALMAVLDMLTPDGWDNYTFMNPARVRLSPRDRTRLLGARGDFPWIESVIAAFDEEEPYPGTAR